MNTNAVGRLGSKNPVRVLLTIVAAALLFWTLPASAGEKVAVQTTSITIALLDPGQTAQTPGGIVQVRGLSVLNMMVSENPLVNGLETATLDGHMDAEGNGVFQITWTVVVGTWDLSSGTPIFTPSPDGGVWKGTGLIWGNFYGRAEGNAVAHGTAGAVKGMTVVKQGVRETFTSPSVWTGWLLDPHAGK